MVKNVYTYEIILLLFVSAVQSSATKVRKCERKANELFNNSVAALQKGDFAMAIKNLTDAINLKPGDPRFYYARGTVSDSFQNSANLSVI